jgi:hypothetical protein
MGTAPVEMTERNMSQEERKNEVRRLVHEFASYAVWHLSLTKPDHIAVRVLVNKMLIDWINDEYVCGTKYCPYCRDDSARGFRHTFRKFVGRSERGRQ